MVSGSRGGGWPSLGTRRARGWLFLLLLALECLCSAFALSTCKTVDMDQMKRKRIEAIRGQILSKLKLSSPPEVEVSESQPLPDDVRALYNSTLQFIKERVDEELPEAPHDDYYAKEVHKFDMLLPTHASYASYPKTRHSIYFVFNLEEIRGILSSPNMVYRAELRMRATGMGQEQRLELYQEQIHSRNVSSWYYLDGRMIKLKSDKEWLSFDVTHVLRVWSGSSERYGRFRLSAHCTCESSPEELKVDIEGMKVKRGDQLQLSQNHQLRPFLLVMVVPPHRVESQSRRYKRDAPGLDYCSQSSEEKNCCVRPLYIDFRKDLKWKWIHEPKGYYANFCMGPCPYLWSLDTQYSKVLSLYTQHNPSASASPCCVPSELEPLGIVYYVGRQAKVEQLSNMVVKSCRCS